MGDIEVKNKSLQELEFYEENSWRSVGNIYNENNSQIYIFSRKYD